MTDAARIEKFQAFKALHEGDDPLVMPNPWTPGMARAMSELGFPALATTSAGLAFDLGKWDSAGGDVDRGGLTRQEVLENAGAIAAATSLPVSADLEGGYSRDPDACASILTDAAALGLVGASIEDASGDSADPIFPFELSVDRVQAAAEAARANAILFTARTENYLYGRPDLADTIKRLQAFEEAGADVLFAPGMTDLGEIQSVVQSVTKPVNVLMGIRQPTHSVEDLAEIGVSRISLGGGLARVAMTAVMSALQEVTADGTFTYSASALSNADVARRTVLPI